MIKSGDTSYFLVFDFDVKFTLLREKITPNEQAKLGEPYGIKLERIPGEG